MYHNLITNLTGVEAAAPPPPGAPVFRSKLGSDAEITSPFIDIGANPPTLVGAPLTYVTGQDGNAVQGTNNKAFQKRMDNIFTNLYTEPGAIGFWWKPTLGFNTAGFQYLFWITTSVVGKAQCRVVVNDTTNLRFQFYKDGVDTWVQLDYALSNFTQDTWYHIAVCWDVQSPIGGTDYWKAFVDGVEILNQTSAPPNPTVDNYISTNQLTFTAGATGGNYMRGDMDDFRIYDFAKTDWSDRSTF